MRVDGVVGKRHVMLMELSLYKTTIKATQVIAVGAYLRYDYVK